MSTSPSSDPRGGEGGPGGGDPPPHRSGFVCLVGRPNVGKSTLLNALVGGKVAITSDKPQTTRNTIRGVVSRADGQLVVVDTPGFHRPRTLLGERLNDMVRGTIGEVDVVGLCIPADAAIGPGDRFIARQLSRLRTPVVGIVTKTDLVEPPAVAAQLAALAATLDCVAYVPVSARTTFQVDVLADLLVGLLPEGPALFPEGQLTDQPEADVIAELVREAVLDGLSDELPHSVAVRVEEMSPREGREDLVDVYAVLYVERDSQKPIVLGPGGSRIKAAGTVARRQAEALLGSKVFLDLRVKVAKDWQRDPRQLRRLGF